MRIVDVFFRFARWSVCHACDKSEENRYLDLIKVNCVIMQSRIVGRKGLVHCLAKASFLAFITKDNKKIQNLYIRHIKDI